MNSPLVFNVAELLRRNDGLPEQRTQVGPSPARIGPEMIAIAEGAEITVDATLTPIGSGVLVDADVSATLLGECVRCLRELTPEVSLHVSQVFADHDDLISGDDAEDDEEDVPKVVDDLIDLEQTVTDEAGLSLPFNPTCEGGCPNDETEVPAPDGVSGEVDPDDDTVDPRWAGLEKFL